MIPSQRTYTNIENGEVLRMYSHPETHASMLINENTGDKVKNFYCSAFTPVEIKVNNKIINLNTGEFYELKKGEVVTHIKYTGFKKFTKIK